MDDPLIRPKKAARRLAGSAGFSPLPPPRGAAALDEPAFTEKHIRLLRSTYRAMAERGVKRLSLREAASAAGVSKGILLYYFGSKENLILSTMRWVLGRVARRIQNAVLPARSAEEKVAAMIDSIFVDPRANRDFYLVFMDLLTYAARLDRFDRLNATFRHIVNGAYAQLIAEGIREGVFRVGDAAEAAAVVRAMMDGLFLQWLEEPQWEALHPQVRELCKRAVLGYLRGGAASRPGVESPA
ncbi:MAG: TetR family transcriptional regulator C-terminal domain-containing protein [Armatimonadota bacterium]|nr:TetR family transcriptional regulator C-terminal domain-containing protein [Armatimonadota bacterium]MDR7427369.1 TetR family transcriptional regulator C-terminal domain-containing protein [Armatimonadota bacterium]MDR7465151.1 TetR family transcriptional regulator C-terminal domain-containing protein [Armatimonadota bacterium]MDR7470084.1 TetR family transcriptional regulator C-terminal domain-containing protein [Armatimonadota bacterium]MDR7474394.1 TetR family transcriptional regulator C-